MPASAGKPSTSKGFGSLPYVVELDGAKEAGFLVLDNVHRELQGLCRAPQATRGLRKGLVLHRTRMA